MSRPGQVFKVGQRVSIPPNGKIGVIAKVKWVGQVNTYMYMMANVSGWFSEELLSLPPIKVEEMSIDKDKMKESAKAFYESCQHCGNIGCDRCMGNEISNSFNQEYVKKLEEENAELKHKLQIKERLLDAALLLYWDTQNRFD